MTMLSTASYLANIKARPSFMQLFVQKHKKWSTAEGCIVVLTVSSQKKHLGSLAGCSPQIRHLNQSVFIFASTFLQVSSPAQSFFPLSLTQIYGIL